ncbi:MAG TPA: membrane dipeptidase [Candidatus Binatia bacterium]|jgi:membrane dipeptidase|nr:membrane dipeptidase [Candidatus Binatia bacterium]
MFIVDAHLDLAYGALRFDRDLLRPLEETRRREARRGSHPEGIITVNIPALLEGGVGLVFATLFAMPESANKTLTSNRRLVYSDAHQAHQVAGEQLDYYWRLADEVEQLRIVTDRQMLEEVLASHEDENAENLLGFVPLMEGADPVRDPRELEEWYERGVRIIGPAWHDTRYAHGAGGSEGFTKEGFLLMEVMADLGFILDITHLSDKGSFEAFERYEGQVIASHSNARALVPHHRHISDELIRRLAERDGVTGVVLFNRFLKAGYTRSDPKESVTLQQVAAHIDHICQLLGDAKHVGIGSDMDGGFGLRETPAELNSSADLPLLGDVLAERGYSEEDIAAIMGLNWIERLRGVLK